jgi:hypothetical protein
MNYQSTISIKSSNIQRAIISPNTNFINNIISTEFSNNNFFHLHSIQEAQLQNEACFEDIRSHLYQNNCTITGSYKSKAKSIISNNFNPSETGVISRQLAAEYQAHLDDFTIKLPAQFQSYTHIHIINIYAPTPGQRGFYQNLYEVIVPWFRGLAPTTGICVLGDFNNILNPEDSSIQRNLDLSNNQGEHFLEAIVKDLNLIDTFNHQAFKTASLSDRFTNMSTATRNANRRLDRIYISDSLKSLKGTLEHQAMDHSIYYSTHKPIKLNLHIDPLATLKNQVGKPRFTLLKSTYSSTNPDDPDEWLNRIQSNPQFYDNKYPEIGSRASSYFSNLSREAQTIQKLRHLLNKRTLSSAEISQQHREEQLASSTPISYCDYKVLNKLYHKQQQQTIIEELIDPTSNEIENDFIKIMDILRGFYEEIYSKPSNPPDDEEIKSYLQDYHKKLTNQQQDKLNSPITLEEFDPIIKKYKHENSSPGADGLTYDFIFKKWNDIGPMVTNLANHLCSGGKLPEYFKKVLIKLLPKKDKDSKEPKNLRPISLISTIIKLISSVANNRILTIIDDLIEPSQTGFIPNRKMEDNINNFQAIRDYFEHQLKFDNRSTFRWAKEYGFDFRMVMLDFEKAFDRLSHQYIKEVMQHIKFPKRLQNLIESLQFQQHGSILLNNFESRSFPLNAGVRQGNPLSSTLFILSIEPLLHHIRLSIQGITLKSFLSDLTLKTSSFADDVTVFARDSNDVDLLLIEVERFGKVSNMRLNVEKSKILMLRKPRNVVAGRENFSENPFPTEYLIDSKDKLLGVELTGIDWKKFTKKIIQNIRYPLVGHLPLLSRCLSNSIYILSQIYFRDPFLFLKPADLNKIILELDKQFRHVNESTLFLPQILGGFGMVNLPIQLHGKRGKFIFELFINDYNWWSTNLRERLQVYAIHLCYTIRVDIATSEIFATPSYSQDVTHLLSFYGANGSESYLGFPWYRILDGTLLNYVNSLENRSHRLRFNLHEDDFKYTSTMEMLKKIKSLASSPTILNLDKYFTKNELQWMESWFEVVTIKHTENRLDFFKFDRNMIYNKYIAHVETAKAALVDRVVDIEGEALSLEGFKHFNKKYHLAHGKPITRRPVYEIQPPVDDEENEKMYATFWKQIKRIQVKEPGKLENLHRFHLGHYDHIHFTTVPDPKYPYKHLPKCILCGQENENTKHLFEDCEVSQKIWKEITPDYGKIKLSNMLLPIKDPDKHLKDLSLYIGIIWNTRVQRRWSSIEPKFDDAAVQTMITFAKSQINKYNSKNYYLGS